MRSISSGNGIVWWGSTPRQRRWRSLESAGSRRSTRRACSGCRGGWGRSTRSSSWGTTSASPGTSRGCDDSCETRGKFRRPAGASSAAPGSQGRGFESTCRTSNGTSHGAAHPDSSRCADGTRVTSAIGSTSCYFRRMTSPTPRRRRAGIWCGSSTSREKIPPATSPCCNVVEPGRKDRVTPRLPRKGSSRTTAIGTTGMPFLDQFRLEALPQTWQDEGRRWQDTYFTEMPAVLDLANWKRFYPDTPVPRLSVIMAKPDGFAGFAQKVVGASAATASLANRVWTADKMPDAQFMTALKIIRAQASTELGSIQQHRMVYEQLDGGSLTGLDREIVEGIHRTDPGGHRLDAISFSKKRVCVEELRHHMQMAGVLTLDATFDKPRWGRHWATETMEELFAMKPGEHVLEMFGSELGGDLVKGVFKTLKNREGQTIYIDEVLGKVKDANLAIIQARGRCNREDAEAALRRIVEKGETVHGLAKDDLLFLPDRRFFRIRGLAEFGDYRNPGADAAGVGYVYLPYDLHGELLTDHGKPIERTAYVDYLRTVLPDRYMQSRHWDFVKTDFLFNDMWGTPEPAAHA